MSVEVYDAPELSASLTQGGDIVLTWDAPESEPDGFDGYIVTVEDNVSPFIGIDFALENWDTTSFEVPSDISLSTTTTFILRFEYGPGSGGRLNTATPSFAFMFRGPSSIWADGVQFEWDEPDGEPAIGSLAGYEVTVRDGDWELISSGTQGAGQRSFVLDPAPDPFDLIGIEVTAIYEVGNRVIRSFPAFGQYVELLAPVNFTIADNGEGQPVLRWEPPSGIESLASFGSLQYELYRDGDFVDWFSVWDYAEGLRPFVSYTDDEVDPGSYEYSVRIVYSQEVGEFSSPFAVATSGDDSDDGAGDDQGSQDGGGPPSGEEPEAETGPLPDVDDEGESEPEPAPEPDGVPPTDPEPVSDETDEDEPAPPTRPGFDDPVVITDESVQTEDPPTPDTPSAETADPVPSPQPSPEAEPEPEPNPVESPPTSSLPPPVTSIAVPAPSPTAPQASPTVAASDPAPVDEPEEDEEPAVVLGELEDEQVDLGSETENVVEAQQSEEVVAGPLAIDGLSALPGGLVVVQGDGCPAGGQVEASVGDGESVIGTAEADGTFSVAVTAPSSPGQYDIVVECGDTVRTIPLSVVVTTSTAGVGSSMVGTVLAFFLLIGFAAWPRRSTWRNEIGVMD